MTKQLLQTYKKFREYSPFMLVGHNAELALHAAKTLTRFRELEQLGKVQILAEPEDENYFDVFGKPDSEKEYKQIIETLKTYGCYYVMTRVNDNCECCGRDEWHTIDSIGMCTGYKNPISPFENSYVIDLMAAAVAHFDNSRP